MDLAAVNNTVPNHEQPVMACTRVYNSGGLSSLACSESLNWDTEPPIIVQMEIWDTFRLMYREPTVSECAFGVTHLGTQSPLHECKHQILSNSSTELLFRVKLNDHPRGGAIKSVAWGVSSSILEGLDESFEELGGGKFLEDPGTDGVWIDASSRSVSMEHDSVVFVHLWMCDVYENCGMRLGYPVHIDVTPPPLPT